MSVISHEQLADFLRDSSLESVPPLILICGDPFLTQQAFDRLADAIVQNHAREFCMETVDGESVLLGDIIEQLATFSFFASPKLVTVKNAPLFSSVSSQEISYGPEEAQRLVDLSSASIPERHFLIFISREMDRRRKIFKLLEPCALIVDCIVPGGSLKSDREAQARVARSIVKKLADQAGKTINSKAVQELMDRVGPDPQNIAGNLEKLIAFSGQRSLITHEDVLTLIKREKKDPIFSFTNAVMDRDAGKALFYLTSLVSDQFHPLQILKSLENQIRKLLTAKYFLTGPDSPVQGSGITGMSFNEFTRTMGPAIVARDNKVKDVLSQDFLSREASDRNKKSMNSDLLLAPSPKNLYPVFQVCQKSENFTRKRLESAIRELADMDYQFKTSVLSPVIMIENFIIDFCAPVGRNKS